MLLAWCATSRRVAVRREAGTAGAARAVHPGGQCRRASRVRRSTVNKPVRPSALSEDQGASVGRKAAAGLVPRVGLHESCGPLVDIEQRRLLAPLAVSVVSATVCRRLSPRS